MTVFYIYSWQRLKIVLIKIYVDIYKVHTPKNALFIKLDEVLKFTLKITLT